MTKLRFLTSGESHGRALVGIIEGIPAGFPLLSEEIDRELKRRQGGYGRGGRMKIESDRARIISGVRRGKTIGSPISLLIENKDWENWIGVNAPRSWPNSSLSISDSGSAEQVMFMNGLPARALL